MEFYVDMLQNYNTLVVGLLTFLLTYYWFRMPNHFPPGPRGFPLIGVIPFLGRFPERAFNKWSRKYGPIMSIRLGREDIIVLNDYESIQKAFAKRSEQFSGRPHFPLFQLIMNGLGLTFVDYGPVWKAQRKFGVVALRGMGVGKTTMENRISEEVAYFSEAIRTQNEKPFNILHLLKTAVSNNICSVLFGKRFDYDDPVFKEIMKRMESGFNSPETLNLTRILVNAPSMMYIPPFKQRLTTLLGHVSAAEALHNQIIEEHEETFDENNLRDFIDSFLLEMKRKTHESFTAQQLPMYTINLFLAGTETVSNTIRWGLLIMLHYPEAQQKLRQEIINVLGSEGKFTTAHKFEMPYTCAFIEELLRFRGVVPISPFHKTTEDVELDGYCIPKNTKVAGNFWAVLHDRKFWKDPEIFKHERHLDEKGQFVQTHRVITFSVGPRHCLGEQLARAELFIFIVALVQKFEFHPDPDASGLPEINDGISGLAFIPLPFNIVAKEI